MIDRSVKVPNGISAYLPTYPHTCTVSKHTRLHKISTEAADLDQPVVAGGRLVSALGVLLGRLGAPDVLAARVALQVHEHDRLDAGGQRHIHPGAALEHLQLDLQQQSCSKFSKCQRPSREPVVLFVNCLGRTSEFYDSESCA